MAPGPVCTGAEDLDPRTVQPVASRCTDWAIADRYVLLELWNKAADLNYANTQLLHS